MRYFIGTAFSIFSLFILIHCKKSDGGASSSPSNLVIKADISIDGSGTVVFTATADGAVSYDYEYGNGEVANATSGTVTFKYRFAGTNTYTVTVTARSSSGSTIKKTIQITVAVNDLPILFWSEEFNVDGAPNSAIWSYDLGRVAWPISELECFTDRPENVIVQGGVLKIKVVKENYQGNHYTSASIHTKDKFAFTYGRVDIRAKLPAGGGTLSALWMLGSNIGTVGWPACGEIDIMEHIGNDLNKIYGTLHYPERYGGNGNGNTVVIANATTEFHIYSVDWTFSYIKFYVDNQLYHMVRNYNMPFYHDFYLILDVAIGGGFGGYIDPAFTGANMELDYIRVYR